MLFKGNANEPDLENFSASGKESKNRSNRKYYNTKAYCDFLIIILRHRIITSTVQYY